MSEFVVSLQSRNYQITLYPVSTVEYILHLRFLLSYNSFLYILTDLFHAISMKL
jgi:hypothetical protein